MIYNKGNTLLEKGSQYMWTVIYVGNNRAEAEVIKAMLVNEGFLVKLRDMDNDHDEMCEVLVPESEADEAHLTIDQNY